MGGIGVILFMFTVIGSIQILLSLRKNHYLGLIVPGLNALMAMFFGMMGTDYFLGYFVFAVLLLPITIWLGIYKLCRIRVNEKIEKDMKKLKIKDL